MEKREIELVYSFEHTFASNAVMPSVAISCRGAKSNNDGGVGFDQCKKTIELRGLIVNNWYELIGAKLQKVGSEIEPEFFPTERKGFRIWSLFVRDGNAPFDSVLRSKEGQVLSNSSARSLGHLGSVNAVHQIVSTAAALDLDMQFWPYMTEHWSICYLFSNNLKSRLEEVTHLANYKGISIVQVNQEGLPVH